MTGRWRARGGAGKTAIGDYGLIGDTHTAALVGRDGSVDWLCLPRFDAGACFAALLGDPGHGRWRLAPKGEIAAVRRRYRDGTLVLETETVTPDGVVRVTDFMPPRVRHPRVVRIVEGVRGAVPMSMELVVRFDYGSIVPWARRVDGDLRLIAGPDALTLRTPVTIEGRGLTTVADFTVEAGDQVPFVLSWHASHEPPPVPLDPLEALADTDRWWRRWSGRSTYDGPYFDAVQRSLITLKALTYAPTGGIVAAPTTSLPEQPGGVRNWDYRYCWLRDATFTLSALMLAGYRDEARDWRDWLLRAAAGHPADLQIMYGCEGERRLSEYELPWLPGFDGSRPVRVGNAASAQFQLDVYGEVCDALHQARRAGIDQEPDAWNLELALLEFLEGAWSRPDDGIWEVRGPRRHFTHSKVMAWVAFDRAIKDAERRQRQAGGVPLERWRAQRAAIHAEVLAHGVDHRGVFVQSYGSDELDAALLMIPLVGFLPATDERVVRTVAAIEAELTVDGLVRRYGAGALGEVDGLPGDEGLFLPCTFWLADNLALQGRHDEAAALFGRLLDVRNDLGLLAEEYDAATGELLGNFPQAFSHVALVNTAHNLAGGAALGRAAHRGAGYPETYLDAAS
jgi:GH15 family glucan-1,4-alpha-glucosidase